MKIKSVIFDLDGTIIDSIQDIAESCNVVLEKHGYQTHPVASYIKWIGEGAKLLVERALPSDTDAAVVAQLLNEYIPYYKDHATIKTALFPGIDKLLDYLTEQNIPFSILTNKPQVQTVQVVDHYLSEWAFSFVFGQRDTMPKKPAPDVALQIASRSKVKPEEVLFVGDSKTDVKTAINANMQVVGVTWGYGTIASMKEAGCTQFADEADEIINNLSSL